MNQFQKFNLRFIIIADRFAFFLKDHYEKDDYNCISFNKTQKKSRVDSFILRKREFKALDKIIEHKKMDVRIFEKTVDEFILRYFKQSFLRASGIYDYIKKPTLYKKNIKAGSKLGRSKGLDTGFKWIANAKISVEQCHDSKY